MTGGRFFIGVDVGTLSARAGVFDANGTLSGHVREPIAIWHEAGDLVEQSSTDIWAAVCRAVRGAVAAAGVPAEAVAGIGFDATCSLVVLDPAGAPLAVGPSEDPARNVIVWMDHRASEQAERINAGGHKVLDYVGGRISPEMETPKLLWLSENRPHTFAAAGHFFDLADFLGWKASGSLARSVCTLVCKWTYLAHEARWDADYFRAIGLGALADEDFARIGREVSAPGTRFGGLTPEAAAAMGLAPGTAVATSLIDAHAGALATLDTAGEGEMALIAGTSACTMTLTPRPVFVPGVWGPYFGAVLPGLWLNEGGQSAFGAALDHFIALHPAREEAETEAARTGVSLPAWLEAQAVARAGGLEAAAGLCAGLHVLPELLGNRAPEADPAATGGIIGLRMESGLDGLVALYVATLSGLACGTARIIDALEAAGVGVGTIVISGGAGQSALMRRILADTTGRRVALPRNPEPVLLGAAMLGAAAAAAFPSLAGAAAAMRGPRGVTEPAGGVWGAFHAARREAYDILRRAEREIRRGPDAR